MTAEMRSAVLMMVFNRPEPTQRVFEAIRAARPPRLYVAADGPRPDRIDDRHLCEKTRDITDRVDWPCEVQTLYQQRNQGCRAACSGAVSWFFENEEEGVILEDDCLPDPSFFSLCDELLPRFRGDTRVGHIGALNPVGDCLKLEASYGFTVHPFVWGWASWRRAWRHYDVTMADWPQWRGADRLSAFTYGSEQCRRYWSRAFDATHSGNVDTWDYQWVFACWAHGLHAIVPNVNLITNLGFARDATHTKGRAPAWLAKNPASPVSRPLNHPATVCIDKKLATLISKNVFGAAAGGNLLRRAYNRLFGN